MQIKLYKLLMGSLALLVQQAQELADLLVILFL
jgi:hypothetical protein